MATSKSTMEVTVIAGNRIYEGAFPTTKSSADIVKFSLREVQASHASIHQQDQLTKAVDFARKNAPRNGKIGVSLEFKNGLRFEIGR